LAAVPPAAGGPNPVVVADVPVRLAGGLVGAIEDAAIVVVRDHGQRRIEAGRICRFLNAPGFDPVVDSPGAVVDDRETPPPDVDDVVVYVVKGVVGDVGAFTVGFDTVIVDGPEIVAGYGGIRRLFFCLDAVTVGLGYGVLPDFRVLSMYSDAVVIAAAQLASDYLGVGPAGLDAVIINVGHLDL
jgi:hypothetical protein